MLTRIKTAALALAALASMGCASITKPHTYGLDADHAALVRQTCSDIMGLPAGVPEFHACGGSLAESVRVQHDARLMAQADSWCEQQGLKPGTADLAKCVLTFRRAEGRSASANTTLTAFSEALPRKSYFTMNYSQQDERAELSCAQLGLHPASVAFTQCVIDLKQAIFAIQNPL
jgi:hypothetical protein